MFGRCRKLIFNAFVAQVLVILACLGVFFSLTTRDYPRHDFVCYWASARLLAAGHNPYDPAAVRQLERLAGFQERGPVFLMRNPPWVLPLVAFLGYPSLHVAALLWAAFMLVLAAFSCWMLTRNHPEKRDLLIYFAPLVFALLYGQTTTVLLFAVSLFLCCRKRPLVAGLALSLTVIKPHLLLVFWPVLLVDCWRRRSGRLALGFLLGLAALTMLSFALDPHAWAEYRIAMAQQGISSQFLPNISAELRFQLFPRLAWVQLVPSLLAVVAALFWYAKAQHWDWTYHGALLVAASVVLSPYSWTYDLALVLPAMLTLPATEELRQVMLIASLMTVLPFEYTRVWASPPMAFAGVIWAGWYCYARIKASRAAIPEGEIALG